MAIDAIDREIKSGYQKEYRRYNLKTAKALQTDPNKVVINDIYFTIPPQQIAVNEEFESMPITKIRRSEAINIPSGYGEVNIGLQILLTEDYLTGTSLESELRYKLIPLLIQLDKNPLVRVKNSYIAQLIKEQKIFNNSDNVQSIISDDAFFAFVDGYTVSNVPGAPRTISLTLRLVLFNYKPYVPRIFYKHDKRNVAVEPIHSLGFYRFFERDFQKKEHLASLSTFVGPDDHFSIMKYTYIEIPSTVDISGTKKQKITSSDFLKDRLKETHYAGLVNDAIHQSKNLNIAISTAHILPSIPKYMVEGIVQLHATISGGVGIIGLHKSLAKELGLSQDYINRIASGQIPPQEQITYLSTILSRLLSIFGYEQHGYKKAIMAYYMGTTNEQLFGQNSNALEFYHQVLSYKQQPKHKQTKPTVTARQAALMIARKYPHIARVVMSRKQLMVLQLRERVDLSNTFLPLTNLQYSVSFHNARIPVAGAIFPTIQYMGVWDRQLELSFDAIGDEGLAAYDTLSSVLHGTQQQYAQSRYFAALFGNEIINHFINNTLRANNFNLRSIDTEISTQMPNVTNVHVAFTDTTKAANAVLGIDKIYYGTTDISDKAIVFSFVSALNDSLYFHYDWRTQRITYNKNAAILGTNNGDLVQYAADELAKILDKHLREYYSPKIKHSNRAMAAPIASGVYTMGAYAEFRHQISKEDAKEATRRIQKAIRDNYIHNYAHLEDLINFTERFLSQTAMNKEINQKVKWSKKYDIDVVRHFAGASYGDMDLSLDENPDDMFVDFKDSTKTIKEKMGDYARSISHTQFKSFQMSLGATATGYGPDAPTNTLLKTMFEEAQQPQNIDAPKVDPGDFSPDAIATMSDFVPGFSFTNTPSKELAKKTLKETLNTDMANDKLNETLVGSLPKESETQISVEGLQQMLGDNLKKEAHTPDYTLRRAFPAYKVYIVEDDFDQILTRDSDDLFELNTIQEIRIIKSREIAPDLAIIKFYDITGYFTSAKFYEGGTEQENKSAQDIDSDSENPFKGIMLKEGVKVHIRMGYDNDANKLTPVFTGIITGVDNDGANVTLVAQSHAIELVSTPLGDPHDDKDIFVQNADTQEILFTLACRPELKHFGRYKGFRPFGYSLQMPDGSSKYVWGPSKYSNIENIFAPATTPSRNTLFAFLTDIDYFLTGQTVWDVFQEMTLRHPGFIAIPRYYQARNLLMTMYFGLPSGVYYYRDKNIRERYWSGNIYTASHIKYDPIVISDSLLQGYRYKGSKDFGDWKRVKPITGNHTVVSGINLIRNSVHANIKDVYTEVRIYYPGNEATVDEQEIDKYVDIKLDDNLYIEDIRKTAMSFGNCVGVQAAYLYGTGVLLDMARHMYKGEIIIQGDPTIEPFDTVFLTDTSTNTAGPVTVRQVEHVISPTDGFITVITPDMVAHPNDLVYMSNLKAAWTFTSGVISHLVNGASWDQTVAHAANKSAKNIEHSVDIPRLGLLTAVAGGAALGGTVVFSAVTLGIPTTILALGAAMFGWTQLTRSRFRHPIMLLPMLRSGVPYIYGVDSMKINGLFTDIKLRLQYWKKSWGAYKETYLSPQNIGRELSATLSKDILETINNIVFK